MGRRNTELLVLGSEGCIIIACDYSYRHFHVLDFSVTFPFAPGPHGANGMHLPTLSGGSSLGNPPATCFAQLWASFKRVEPLGLNVDPSYTHFPG